MNNKLFIGGLSWNTDNDSLQSAFSKFGNISECKVITDRMTGKSKGFGFVTFETADDASKAQKEMNEQMLDGRTVRVDFATEKKDDGPRGGGDGYRGGGGGRGGYGGGHGGGGNRGPRY